MNRLQIFAGAVLISVALGTGAGVRSFVESYGTASALRGAALARNLAASEAYVSYLRQGAPVTLLFGGDVMLARSVAKQIGESGDPRFPFLEIASTTRGADIAFANGEGTISSRGRNQGSAYSFRADPSVVSGLVFAGFDVLSLANNHIWDWGRDALVDTVSNLNTAGIETVGAGNGEDGANRPVVENVRGTRVGFLAYTTLYPESLEARGDRAGISSFSVERAVRAVTDLKKEAGIVVVSMHWGEEYKTSSSAEQKEIAHALGDAGASLVIGHHPHVTQEVEKYRSPVTGKDTWIAYSLGNLVFDQPFSRETMESFLLEVIVRGSEVRSVREIPVVVNARFQPVPAGV